MKRILTVLSVLSVMATGMSHHAYSGIISPLVVLPSTSVPIPGGKEVRMYSAPMILGNIFFDGKTSDAYILSSDPSMKKLITTDSAGNAATLTDSDVLAGVSSKSGIIYGDSVVVVIDYYPEGGAYYSALYKIAKNGTFNEWKLSQGHGGTNFVIPGVKNNLFLPAALPAGISMQQGITAKVLKSNYTFGPIGNVFFGPDGSLYAFTSSANRKRLAKIEASGSSSSVTESDILVGQNLRAGALYGNAYVAAVDYAPETGNQLGGIYVMNNDGTYSAWNLSQSHSGISDLIPAPQGGYYFTDFENDNIWHITLPGEAETPLLKSSPVAPMSVAANDNGDIYMVNWIPGEWWSNGGVNAVYRITGDSAVLVVQAPEGSRLFSIAAAKGGIFGNSFYVTDTLGGRVFRVETDNTLSPVITGLTNPGRIKFDPITGDMVVVCNGQHIMWFGANLTPFVAQSEPSSSPKGLFFSDFENDNVWFVPTEGKSEIPILESNIPPGLGTIAYNDLNNTIYAVNWKGNGWPFGGEDAVYEIGSNGIATQVIKGNFSSIAMSRGGPFGRALYVSDSQAGKIMELEEGKTAVIVSGLPSPSAISFDPISGNMVVVCDGGKSVVWIGVNLESPADGEPGTIGTFFVPTEQDFFQMGKNTIKGGEVSLEISDEKPGGYSAISKKALSGDFEITASIRMSIKTLQQGQNRNATFSVVSDVAGQRSNQAYIGILQKTVGYASTGGQYSVYTDMCIGSWGRFNSRSLTGEPFSTFKIARKDGVISTYYMDKGEWVKLSTATDGFNDRVRVYFSVDTSWDASIGVAHSAVFNAIDLGEANQTAVLADFNDDGFVSLADLVLLGSKWGLTSSSPDFVIKYDLNKDGSIGLADLVILGSQWTGLSKVAKAVPAASVTLDLTSKRNEASTMFYVNVSAKGVTGIDGIAFSLKYNTNVLEFVKDSLSGLGAISVTKDSKAGVIDIASVYKKEKFSGIITLGFKVKGRTSDINVRMVNAEVAFNGVISSDNDQTVILKTKPNTYLLSQNIPNPFNPTTIIRYTIPGDEEVSLRLKIYDSRGTIVKTLVNGTSNPGIYSATWNATDDAGRRISSGIYFYRLEAGSFTQTRKMLFLR
jgi:hypothetical protein